jgi:hypothetical protein
MRHPLFRLLLTALLLGGGAARAEVVALSLRPESKKLDTLDWRHASERAQKQATFSPGMPLYVTVELGFQEPAPRPFPLRLVESYVQKITVQVGSGSQSRKAYLLVDEQGRGVAVDPGREDAGGGDSVGLVQAEKSQGTVGARFGIPVWAPMPVDDHLEIAIGVSTLPSIGRTLFDDLVGAATAQATGLVSGVAGDAAGQALQKPAERALAWLKQGDEQLGKPLILKRLQACRDSPLTCGGVLGSQVVVVTEADGPAEDFATTHEVKDGLLRVTASGGRHPAFAAFIRLQVEPLPKAAFSSDCLAALQQDAWSKRPALAEKCPVEGLAASHQARFSRLRDALDRLQPALAREESAARVQSLASTFEEVCGGDDAQLPTGSVPCQVARTFLERKPQPELRKLGGALARYREELQALAALPVGGPASCAHERDVRERFQRASAAFVESATACRFDGDDLPHPLRCGGLPDIEALAASIGQKRGELVDACREQGLCQGAPDAEPALRMALEAVCGKGIRQEPASFALDTTPIVAAFEGATPNVSKEPLDATSSERVLAALRTRSDATGRLPETGNWRTLMASLRQRLDTLYGEYVAARQFSEELGGGELAASRQVARELVSLTGPVRAESSDGLERTLFADLEELGRMPPAFPRLFKGGKDHFVPVLGAARELRLGRSALYRRLVQDLESVRQRQPSPGTSAQPRAPLVAAPAD